ncbi:RNA-binding domain-containing protein, partial [Microstroma glucosiphilum]
MNPPGSIPGDPRTSLLVSNLPYKVRWQDLKDLFRRSAGTVLRADVSLTPDGRSRCFGSVLMRDPEDARRAKETFDGFEWMGKRLSVMYEVQSQPAFYPNPQQQQQQQQQQQYQPQQQQQYQPQQQSQYGGAPDASYYGRTLFVGNLAYATQWQDLKDLFRAAGNIMRADIALGTEGRSRGFGTVLFGTKDEAARAVKIFHG